MARDRLLRFRIDSFTPETIPMSRLAEYMADLAKLLGERPNVHFRKIEKGSAALVAVVKAPVVTKVMERARSVQSGPSIGEAGEAYRNLNHKLQEDNSKAVLLSGRKAKILEFPGRDLDKVTFAAFNQLDTIDGVLMRIGGRQPKYVHAQIDDGETVWRCHIQKDKAKELAVFLFGARLRISGTARWMRNRFGQWEMNSFRIESFEPLDDKPLSQLITGLRSIKSGWDSSEDPQDDLKKIRHG